MTMKGERIYFFRLFLLFSIERLNDMYSQNLFLLILAIVILSELWGSIIIP